ncbi:MAG TPA: carbohydrate ABC transporter permease, partial [Ktedonobacteraceae bacterium]|nr:carbohydrate ABC transporter permease [Ktedonobacteraceae bacterium]
MATLSPRSTSVRTRHVSIGPIVSLVLRYTLLIILALLFLLPFYLVVRNSLGTDLDITSPHWTFFPATPHFENVHELFSDPDVPFLSGLINSALISV